MTTTLADLGDFRMYLLDDDPGISAALRKPGGSKRREVEFMTVLRRELVAGSIAMDIGANIGFTALAMCRCIGPTGRIYAVEPVLPNFNVLIKNIKLNGFDGITTAENLAISDYDGEIKFHLSEYSNLGSIRKFNKTARGIVKVKCVCLDSYLKNLDLPTFYKMDIEGAEVNVINGMKRVAAASIKGTKILIEVHPQLYNGDEMRLALESMLGLGYYFKYVISAAIPCPKLFRDRGYAPSEVYPSGSWSRGVFVNVKDDDAIYFTAYPHTEFIKERNKTTPKIVRSIMLEKR